ncbi:MAG: Wzz/FepE/Etk N-terminal domain-containing protein [Pseudomonadota bacterium]
MGQIQTLDDLISFLTRRKWIIGLIAILGIALSVAVAKLRPDSYETAATIQVQGAQVSGDGAGQGGSAVLLQTIQQQLTTRDAMLAVIERHGLFTDLPLSMDEKIGLLRASVRFDGIASVGSQSYGAPANLAAIVVVARLGSADQAARVANDFAQSILDMSSVGTADKARETLQFFADERSRIEAEIAAQETLIADYKNANGGALPAMVETQRTELTALDSDTRALDQQLLAVRGEMAPLEQAATLRATERRRLADLTAQARLLSDQKTALATRRAEIATVIAQTPEVERQLSGFDRQLVQLREQYQVITRRLAEAETTQRLAERQQGERFALLERAETPLYPTGSGGKKIALAGAMVSLVIALGLAFLLDVLNPVVRTAAQMERQLGLRPVVTFGELDLGKPRKGGGSLTALPDLRKQVQALPRFVVVSAGMTMLLLMASAFV